MMCLFKSYQQNLQNEHLLHTFVEDMRQELIFELYLKASKGATPQERSEILNGIIELINPDCKEVIERVKEKF